LCDVNGNQLAHSASTALSGTRAYQRIPFTATYNVVGPATYFVLVQFNNIAQHYRSHTVGNFGSGKITGTSYGTYPTVTPPTTFTTGQGPIASLY
jgi:hypothetical protein